LQWSVPPALVIEEAQVVLHKAHQPDLLGDLLDADGLAAEGSTEIDLAPTDTDSSAVGDDDGAIVQRVLELAEAAIRPCRGLVELGADS
jgi:hypothetical protein